MADFLGMEQRTFRKRIYISLPLFVGALIIILLMPFRTMWSYFAWMNQTLAVITLWAITAYFYRAGGLRYLLSLIPALVMTYVCSSYVFVSPLMCGMENRTLAYAAGAAVTLAIYFYFLRQFRNQRSLNGQKSS